MGPRALAIVAVLALSACASSPSATTASSPSPSPSSTTTTLTGTIGTAQYRIEVPAAWNGTLFLYSHGYVAPGTINIATDSPAASGIEAIRYAVVVFPFVPVMPTSCNSREG